MEKQRLMSDEEEHFLVRNDKNMRTRSEKSKETYRQCDRRSNNNENSHNSFLEGKSLTSEHQKQPNKSNNFMSAFSDFFGLKSSGGKANGSSNCSSLVVSVLIAFLYVASAVFLSNGCESLGVSATPLSSGRQPSMFHSSPSARNIRHLPCISRRTKEEGICMFAIDCLKANGTHLGTCIDRFYFGSCCQMPEQLDPISTNHIEDNSIFGQTFLKPKPEKIEPDDKLDSILNSLSPLPSSTFAPKPTSPKTVVKVQPATATPKPSTTTVKPSVRYTTTTQKPKPQSLKPSYVSHKPSVAVNKPTLANQKYGGPSQKPNATQNHSKLPTTAAQGTRRPHPSPVSHFHTKKPITTGVVVNNTYSSKLPSTYVSKPETNATIEEVKVTKPVDENVTKPEEEKVTKPEEEKVTKPEEEKVSKPEESSIKPLRNATVVQTTAIPLSTTTQKSANMPTRRVSSTSTTETPSSTTKFTSTTVFANETTTAKAVTADLQRVTSTTTTSTTTRMPETTTQTYKISTFQSVQGGQTQKTTRRPIQQPSSNRPITTKRPPAPEKEDIGSQLPFGTRLPSTTARPEKPTVPINIKTPTPQINRITSPSTSTASPPASTTQVPSSQRPIQRPKPTFKPERPAPKPSDPSTTTTIRPLVQRPQNSTLSNRRTTTLRPTTLIKRPTVQTAPSANVSSSVAPTKRPTTIIYRPSIETKPSLKPTYITMKPASPATPVQKPANTVTLSPSQVTNFTRRPVITIQVQNTTKNATAQAPVKVSENKTTNIAPLIKKPAVNVTETVMEKPSTISITSTSSTTAIPSASEKATTAKPALSSTAKPTPTSTAKPVSSTTVKTVSSSKAPPSPSKPLVKPSQGPSIVSVKPSVSTQGSTTIRPITNEVLITNEVVQDNLAQKPTEGSKTPSATTQKIGLVTWSNYVDTAVSQNSSSSTTEKEEDWSPITPPAEWVLLQTVSPTNLTGPTESPPAVVAPAKKPIFDNSRPKPPTPVPSSSTVKPSQVESTTKKPVATESTTKRVVTAESTTKIVVPAESATKKPVVTESATRKPETETTSTKKPPTKPVFTVHITTKPAIKPAATENATTVKPAVESSTITSVSGGSTTTLKPVSTTAKIGAGNTTNSDEEEESTTLEDTTTNEGENATSVMGESGNITTSSGEGTTDKSTVSPIEGITSSGSPIANIDSLNMSDYKDVCGRRLWPEARVVGGSRANFGRWPWQVSLRQWRTSTYLHKCGAALLSENWAVTAAHCVDSVPPSDLLLRLGEHDLASEEEPYGFQERRVQIVASHPQFDPRTFEYDLALLRFYEPVTFQPNILPVCVPANDEGFVGKTAYVTGWGRLYEDGPLPSVLQEVSVPVLENQACEQMYRSAGYIEHIPHIFICAGWRKGGFDSCEGDSGGPMVIQRDDKRFMLGGIISWGIGCAEPNQPGVYTRISEFRDWINQILQF